MAKAGMPRLRSFPVEEGQHGPLLDGTVRFHGYDFSEGHAPVR